MRNDRETDTVPRNVPGSVELWGLTGRTTRQAPAERLTVVLTGTASDAHTWNLVFLQLFLAELGCDVVNVGACSPDSLVQDVCMRTAPDLVVVSSVNGHGAGDGARLARRLREVPALARIPLVIGGKLGTGDQPVDTTELAEAGYNRVFGEDVAELSRMVAALATGAAV